MREWSEEGLKRLQEILGENGQKIVGDGWKEDEIKELFIFLTGFVGFPATVEAFKTLQEVMP